MINLDKTFAQSFRDGEVDVSAIHDYVDYWHVHDTGNKLHQFLGLTMDEFESWVAGSDEDLNRILGVDPNTLVEEVPVCKVCGNPMGVQTAIGILAKSNYLGTDICRDCMIEHCCNTNCVDCKLENYSDCSYVSLKEYYMSNED